jgi:hypothetical protein
MTGYSLKVSFLPTLGKTGKETRSMRHSFGPCLSRKFLTLGRRKIQVGTKVQVRATTTGAVVREMTVVLVRETTEAMTVVTQDKTTGEVAVTVIQDVVDEMTGIVVETEAGTLVSEIPEKMTVSPSSLH